MEEMSTTKFRLTSLDAQMHIFARMWVMRDSQGNVIQPFTEEEVAVVFLNAHPSFIPKDKH